MAACSRLSSPRDASPGLDEASPPTSRLSGRAPRPLGQPNECCTGVVVVVTRRIEEPWACRSRARSTSTSGTRCEDWDPFAPPKAPEGAPNVVYVVLDDVGFSAMSCYGGPIDTPNIDRIAGDGVRYTQWHTTALCSPTRSCLLTGRNHTRNSMACITEGASGFAERQRHHPAGERHAARDPRRAGLEHLHGRQVAPVPHRRDEPGLDPPQLADRARVRAVVRLPRRRDQPVVPGADLRQPPGRPAEDPGGGLPLRRGHHRQGDRVHHGRQGGRPRQAVLPVLRARRRPRPAPRPQGVDREVRRPLRRGLRGDARDHPGPADRDGHRPARHRAAADEPDRHARRPAPAPTASRSRRWTPPGPGTRCRPTSSGCSRGWPRSTPGSCPTPTPRSGGCWTTSRRPASARTPWSSSSRTTAPAARAARTGRSTRCCS